MIFVAIMGFLVSTVCGYMAGLIGSSNSPLSGIGILVVVICALLLVFAVKGSLPVVRRQGAGGVRAVRHRRGVRGRLDRQQQPAGSEDRPARRCDTVASSSGRWWSASSRGRSSFRRCSICVNHAYGFLGAPGVNPARALPAPQAGLISALAQGVIQNNIDWSALGAGGLIGAGCIVFDEVAAPHGQGEGGAPAAARRGTRYLSADREHPDDRRRLDRRLGVQSPRRARPQAGSHATARRAARLRADRRRESARRRVRRGGRLLGQSLPPRPGRR